MSLPSLKDSVKAARDALGAIVASPLPPKLSVADHTVEIVDEDSTVSARRLLLRWEGGQLRLTIGIENHKYARNNFPEDREHGTGLGAWAAHPNGEVLWCIFERPLRDAIRAKRAGNIPLIGKVAFYERVADDPARNKVYGEQARALASQSGLGGRPEVTFGVYDLATRTWEPAPAEILHRFATLALIKAHFYAAGKAQIRGRPLFEVEGGLAGPGPEAESDTPDEKPAPPRITPLYLPPPRPALALTVDSVTARLTGFECPPGVLERCCAALNAGKHLLLLGPPGTGKSTIAAALAEQAHFDGVCDGKAKLATASADWSTYDTIGGWAQQADGRLAFREGVVTRALRERRWVVLDEVNRADIDKCFGELFTVLSGGTVTTAYTDANGDEVTIGSDSGKYRFDRNTRLIATMNVRDKASLFRLSYAFMRRFATVHVPGLDDAGLQRLARRVGENRGLDAERWELAARLLSRAHGLGDAVDLGPALLLDVLGYAAERPDVSAQRAIGEGVELLVFPQLEGAEDDRAQEALVRVDLLFTEETVRHDLHTSLRSYFPHIKRT